MTPNKLLELFQNQTKQETFAWAKKRGLPCSRRKIYTHFFGVPKCYCGKPLSWAYEHQRYRTYCSKECMNAAPEVKEKRKKTNFIRYGGEPNQHPDIRAKKIAVFVDRYGVDNPSKAEEVKDAKRLTSLIRFGAEHWTKVRPSLFKTDNPMHNAMSKRKQRATLLRNHGVENPMHSTACLEKRETRCLEKFGVDNPRKSQVVKAKVVKAYQAWIADPKNKRSFVKAIRNADRHSFQYYSVTDCFGEEHRVQGYERLVIPKLTQKQGVTMIRTERLPLIKYDETRYYIPDIAVMLKDGRKILLEVKSMYTLCYGLDRNIRKFRAAEKFCEKRGWEFLLLVVTPDKEKAKLKVFESPSEAGIQFREQGLAYTPPHNRR